MPQARRWRSAFTLFVCLSVFGTAGAAAARQPAPNVERPAQPQPPPQVTVSRDASETREEFESILKRLPPTVGRVLRTDPSLMRNQSYLATYPTLSAFLQQHPEVVSSPAYYLENVNIGLWSVPRPVDPRTNALNMWENFIEGLAMMIVFAVITGGILWLVRTALRHHRWSRSFKAQIAMQNKILDRFTSNEDLLAYINTPGGRQFVDLVPQPAEPARPAFSPFSRILWAVQIGLVLAAGAVGLIFVSRRLIEEVGQVFFAAGVLALALGVGFVISAAASLLLSQRLGLLASPAVREHSST